MSTTSCRSLACGAVWLMAALTCVPASAQVDFSGDWVPPLTHDNNEDTTYGYYSGVPFNNSARLQAEAWDESQLSSPEWQCKPHGSVYFMRAPLGRLHIQREFNPVTGQFMAWSLGAGGTTPSSRFMIYMDGRSEPSDLAPHTWFGFSKGTYEGSALKFTTTHLKEDTSRRLGVPSSDQAVLTQYWMRHGDLLTWIYIDTDPVYLTEPMVRSVDFRLNLNQDFAVNSGMLFGGCTVVEELDRPNGSVRHYLPGTNQFLHEYADKYNLPQEFMKGGASTMYPEAERAIIRRANGGK